MRICCSKSVDSQSSKKGFFLFIFCHKSSFLFSQRLDKANINTANDISIKEKFTKDKKFFTMKFALLAFVGFTATAAFVVKSEKEILAEVLSREIPVEADRLSGKQLVDYVNLQQNFFEAEESKWSMEEMKRRIMDVKYIHETEGPVAPEIDSISDEEIPASFDSREKWSQCAVSIGSIRDQSDCGSCWAFGAAEAISDRICVATNGAVQVTISAEDLLSCCGLSCGLGCEGGYALQAWKHWESKGICTGGPYGSHQGCKPYAIKPCEHRANESCPIMVRTPKCSHECAKGYSKSYNDDKYYGRSAYMLADSVTAIQKEIMTNGPVEAGFNIYEDFYHYKKGIYVHTAGILMGGHDAKIIGWGSESGTPYWLVANSWGAAWGEDGYFRIIRGLNECNFESEVVAGMPKI